MSSTSITRRSKLQRDKTITSFGDSIFPNPEESGPIVTSDFIPVDLISFRHSYGYNCKKPYNLYLLGTETLVFLSGNIIHFLNTRTLEITIRRSVLGTGIGCITKNSHLDYLTIGENGGDDTNKPPIFIYNYPQMELQQKLIGGAKRNHTRLTYSADGQLLASQSGDPDFMLTIWNWRDAQIILRMQSFSKDVYNLKFSNFTSQLLCSGGAGHIKFWRLCRTFTGMKLQDNVGRFGKTETSDIYGLYQLEDGKVLSGSDWGNLLVWENNAIKYEVFRKNHKPCHDGPITQIIWHDQDLMTVSMDGYVRLWFWETVEAATPAEDENFVEVEPIFEVKIGGSDAESCQLMSIVKDPSVDSQLWYIQDGNGGIWSCNISSSGASTETSAAKQLYQCHAGAICTVSASPCSSHVATLGADGRLHVYNYLTHELVYQRKFKSKGAALIWTPLSIAKAGNNLIVGFESGVIRLLVLEFDEQQCVGSRVLQKLKSHTRAITRMSMSPKGEILVTGAEDHTLFVHEIERGNCLRLIPIGLVVLTSLVSSIDWNEFQSPTTVLVGCRFGEIFEIELPERAQPEATHLSYDLKDLPTRILRFKSKKSEIRRLVKVKEFWYKKTFMKDAMEDKMKELGEDKETEEDLNSHFVPPIPNKILWLRAISRDRLWVAVAQFDAGFIYEYEFGQDEEEAAFQRVVPVPGCPDLEINSIVQNGQFLIFGLSNGMVRVTRMKEDRTDLSEYWQLGMHDNENGTITAITFSFDSEYVFTCGQDGNLFQYKWNGGMDGKTVACAESWLPVEEIKDDDIADEELLSLEEEKRKLNDDQRHTICDANKKKVLTVLQEYKTKFIRIWDQNQSLAESQRLDENAFELDKRITDDLNETLDKKMKMAQREMEYDVERAKIGVRKLMDYFINPLDSFPIRVLGIRSNESVYSLRIRKLDDEFCTSQDDLRRRMAQFKEESKERRQSMSVEFSKQLEKAPASSSNEDDFRVHRIESVLLREMGGEGKLSNLHTKIRRLLKRYKERKAYEQERKLEWERINQQKPNSAANHPDDEQAIMEGEKMIGDYKLKLDDDFVPPESDNDNLLTKLQEILGVQERIYAMKRAYNDEIFEMRNKKERLLSRIKQDEVTLKGIHGELPEEMRREMVEYKDFDEDIEFPEKFLGRSREELMGNTRNGVEDLGILDLLSLHEDGEGESSPAEEELQSQRISRKAFEQDQLLITLNGEIAKFDRELRNLSRRRLTVEMDSLFLETFLLTLQKEYKIILDFHEEELKCADLVDSKRIENGQFLSKILAQESALEACERNIEMHKNEKRVLQQTFDSNCLDNKFTEFLKWIFEKNEEESLETVSQRSISSETFSSITTTTSGQEEFSITSSNYDETFCPRGCDPDLYKLVFDLRQSRFELNKKIADENQVYERVKGDLEFLTKEIRIIQQEQKRREDCYIAVRREKQSKLNAIDTLVVLRLDQLQYFKDETEFGDISKTLLFKRANLMRLYARVNELSSETLQIKRAHRVNIVFLSRLKSDCHYMEQQIQGLRDNIKEAMVKKFGMTVDLDELQEALLKKLLFEIRLNVDDVEMEFRRKIADHKRGIAEKQVELTKCIQEGTEKLNVLTVLHEEKNGLDEILANQIKLRKKRDEEQERRKKKGGDYHKDLEGLRQISQDQVKQIEYLQREIRTLSLKCKPFTSTVPALPAIGDCLKQKRTNTSKECTEFEGSAYASVLNSELSSDRSVAGESGQLTGQLRDDIEKLAVKFIRKHFQQRFLEKQISKLGASLVDYFQSVLVTYDDAHRDELLPCIVEDVLKLLPRDASLLLSQSSVVHLFDRVLRLYSSRNEIDTKDIVWGIIENACEVVGGNEMNVNMFYVEIWRQFFITLPLKEVRADTFAGIVQSCFSRLEVTRFDTPLPDPGEILKEVKSFVLEHATEDISHDEIEGALTAYFG